MRVRLIFRAYAAERGLFSVDDNIADYISADDLKRWGVNATVYCPRLYNSMVCEVITFRNLMAMRAGIMDPFFCPYYPTQWQAQYCVPEAMQLSYSGSISALVSQFIDLPLQTPVDTEWEYNNPNYMLLSFFVEKLSGMSLKDYFKQYIFGPAGLEHTFMDPLEGSLELHTNVANGYYEYTDLVNGISNTSGHHFGNCASFDFDAGFVLGAGGVISSARDLVRWYTSLFVSKNLTSVISQASLDEILTPVSYIGHGTDGIGCDYFNLGVVTTYASCDSDGSNPDLNSRYIISFKGDTKCHHSFVSVYYDKSNLNKQPLVSCAIQNNEVVNASVASYEYALSLPVGNMTTLMYGIMQWGTFGNTAAKTGVANAEYFTSRNKAYASDATTAVESVVYCKDGEDAVISSGVIAAAVIVPTSVVLCVVLGYLHFYLISVLKQNQHQQQSGGRNTQTEGVAMSPMASKELA